MHRCKDKLPTERIFEKLMKNAFFRQIDKQLLTKLINQLWQYEIEAGEVLMNEGEIDGNLYVLISGRVLVSKEVDNVNTVVNELGPGEMVGIHSLLSGVQCTATITALRNTKLLIITRKTFKDHIANSTQSLLEIANIGIRQALGKTQTSYQGVAPRSITLLPAGGYGDLRSFVDMLEPAINRYGQAIFIDEDFVVNGALFSVDEVNDQTVDEITQVIERIEDQCAYIVYIADNTLSPWTQLCIRLADRILAVANETDNPNLTQAESAIFSEWAHVYATKELLLIHEPDKPFAFHRTEWTKTRKIDHLRHMRQGNLKDMSRIARFITGNTIALVLSGGGAKGLAHFGLLRALKELNIEIDCVAGTSIGALFAALYSVGVPHDKIYSIIQKRLTSNYAITDFTIPTKALSSGKTIDNLMIEYFTEELRLEELWKPVFVIATNLSTGQVAVLDSGKVWLAVRASISLPGIFPPIVDNNGNILVDGGILNNLPVDVMSSRLRGNGKIIAVRIEPQHSDYNYQGIIDESDSLFSKIAQHVQSKEDFSHSNLPNIFLTISRSMMISSYLHSEEMLKLATHPIIINPMDYHILDFKEYDKIINLGYNSAMYELRKLMKYLG